MAESGRNTDLGYLMRAKASAEGKAWRDKFELSQDSKI